MRLFTLLVFVLSATVTYGQSISDIQEGKNYAILKGGDCELVLEYYYQDAAITEAVIYDCCEQGHL